MLGSTQTGRVKEAAFACAAAMKGITSQRMKGAAVKAVKGSDPDQAYRALTGIALKASVAAKLSEKSATALRSLQAAYHDLVETWTASPSEKHQREMVTLFNKVLRSAMALRKV